MNLIAFCILGLVLYVYGVVFAPYTPSHIEGVALPLDFMIGIPLGFCLLVIRPRKLTLLSVIAVIWVGYGLSVFALGSADAGVLPEERAFTYHNAGGCMSMMVGLALAFPVEIVGVHLLISQWSVVAACVVTALSVYAAIWLIGDARARVMRPVAIGGDCVRLECGIQMEAALPLSAIEVCLSEDDMGALAKADKLKCLHIANYAEATAISSFRPRARTTFCTVSNEGLPAGDSAL